jgi:hypothetical protein
MNVNHELERRLTDHFASEAPLRAPERVLESALATSEITRQRRAGFRLPWRFPIMNSYAKMAIAALAVIAIGAVGLAVLRPGTSPAVGGPASPSPSDGPLPSQLPSLSETFTSAYHGVSVSYPAGWVTRAATETWPRSEAPFFGSTFADVMYDAALEDHLFLSVQSQPLAGASGDEWANEITNESGWDDPCPPTLEPITIDGADGALLSSCTGSIPRAMAWTTDRGYLVFIYGSDDVAQFREILATVQLHPEDAVAATEPPDLTETFSSPTNGIAVSYPTGWRVEPATSEWTTGIPLQGDSFRDLISDPLRENTFLLIASQALGKRTGEQFVTDTAGDPAWGDGACQPTSESAPINGISSSLVTHCDGTLTAVASYGDRGYLIVLFGIDDVAWFREILASAQLSP